MSKKEKNSQLPDDGELSENEVSSSFSTEKVAQRNVSSKVIKDAFIPALEASVRDLWYLSETDAEIEIFIGKKANSVTREILTGQINVSTETNIEEKDFSEFFKNLTKIQDWYGEEEKETAAKFSTIRKLLEENLKNLKVFKVGRIEIDIYVVGLDSQSVLSGIKTKAVET